jgi:carbon-monoxide dehydrogenase medium subunit
VIPVAFDYLRPSTVDDAVRALADGGEDAKVLAGGQSLLPVLRLRLAAPSVLVDLGGITGLRGIREAGDELVIGAMTRHADVLADPLVRRYVPLLAKATATVADRQVRHLGTVGGSLSHADPAGDLPGVSVALDATMEVTGPGGARRIPAAEFFVDYLTTALAPGELLTAIRVPKREHWGAHYEKFNRVAQAWALVAVSAMIRRDNGAIAEARVVLTNMGPTPVRARAVEESLTGSAATPAAMARAAVLAGHGTEPAADLFASTDYRTHLATVLTRRAVMAAGRSHAV